MSHNGGNLYKAKACRKSDKKLSWNLTGPQGPPGVQGIHGVQGIQGTEGQRGEPGPAGPASTQEAFNSLTVGNGFGAAVIVDCPTGTIATGGGGFSTRQHRRLHVHRHPGTRRQRDSAHGVASRLPEQFRLGDHHQCLRGLRPGRLTHPNRVRWLRWPATWCSTLRTQRSGSSPAWAAQSSSGACAQLPRELVAGRSYNPSGPYAERLIAARHRSTHRRLSGGPLGCVPSPMPLPPLAGARATRWIQGRARPPLPPPPRPEPRAPRDMDAGLGEGSKMSEGPTRSLRTRRRGLECDPQFVRRALPE